MKKNNAGITLMALVITIIVMLIIFSISVYEGDKLIKRSKLQTLETNMLTIQAKVKAYSEEIEAKVWTENEENKEEARETAFEDKGMTKIDGLSDEVTKDLQIQDDYDVYKITDKALVNMGLEEIKDEEYVALFSKKDYKKIEIVYPKGVSYDNNKYYSLYSLSEAVRKEE